MDAVNIGSMLGRFDERRAPRKIAEINDYDVKIAKVQGERSDVETAVLLVEPRGVVNTGDAGGDLTAQEQTLS